MVAIERDNPSLKGVLLKDCGRSGLDKQRLGQPNAPASAVTFVLTVDFGSVDQRWRSYMKTSLGADTRSHTANVILTSI